MFYIQIEQDLPEGVCPKGYVNFGGDLFLAYDIEEFYSLVDALANVYGLGGCRSLSEYAEMINVEDPSIIDGLLSAATERVKREVGKGGTSGGKDRPKRPRRLMGRSSGKGRSAAGRGKSPSTKGKGLGNKTFSQTEYEGGGRETYEFMANFLMNNGASITEVQKALEKLRSGEIKIDKQDFSWITTENVLSDDFDLQKALKQMSDYEDQCINFKIKFSEIGNVRN